MSYQLERRVERLEKDVAREMENDPEAARNAEREEDREKARQILAEYIEKVGDEAKARAMFAEDAPTLYADLMGLPPPPQSEISRDEAWGLFAEYVEALGGDEDRAREMFRQDAPSLAATFGFPPTTTSRGTQTAVDPDPATEPGPTRPLTSDETRELVWKLWHDGGRQ